MVGDGRKEEGGWSGEKGWCYRKGRILKFSAFLIESSMRWGSREEGESLIRKYGMGKLIRARMNAARTPVKPPPSASSSPPTPPPPTPESPSNSPRSASPRPSPPSSPSPRAPHPAYSDTQSHGPDPAPGVPAHRRGGRYNPSPIAAGSTSPARSSCGRGRARRGGGWC